ncbi:type 2 periplasmic-binding domain-containing protein [Amycolatopsis alkalitolerans]|uniref:hypothetical protein n=1 Tax=Amycolatopsis alkalitolerans TaxID=2547244 RepID=UPI001F4454A4|nr:hypothetical protein [Amycolatopsis alkalitolerans]
MNEPVHTAMLTRRNRGPSRSRGPVRPVQDSELVAMVPRLVARIFASEHRVRLLELPMDIEPAQVSIYARHAHARTPAQHWLTTFMHDLLAAPG